jgi:hypothetical protein
MMNLIDKAVRYQRIHGTRKLMREGWARVKGRLRRVLPESTTPRSTGMPPLLTATTAPASHRDQGWVNGAELVASQARHCAALRLFTAPRGARPRVNVVTDSINSGSLYGGVGTAVIMACHLARARGATLRIITRTERARPSNLAGVLSTYGIRMDHEVVFAFAPFYDTRYQLEVSDGDLFITTSWSSTAATMASVRHDSVVYLLQEDERMFYPHGDEHLHCSRVLRNPDLRFVVNTRLLFDHLVASGLDNVARNGIAFEPAFPPHVYRRQQTRPGQKRTLAFYARPNNLRNLFHFGVEVLEAALERGIVRTEEWDIVFLGKDIPKIKLNGGRYTPRRLENLKWADYADFAGTVDLALCLMYTPHPSYPPFDMAASGAVVVTNRFANKQDLGGYCENILCGETDLDAMLEVLAQGVALAGDEPRRSANARNHNLPGDWAESFAPVVARFGGPA